MRNLSWAIAATLLIAMPTYGQATRPASRQTTQPTVAKRTTKPAEVNPNAANAPLPPKEAAAYRRDLSEKARKPVEHMRPRELASGVKYLVSSCIDCQYGQYSTAIANYKRGMTSLRRVGVTQDYAAIKEIHDNAFAFIELQSPGSAEQEIKSSVDRFSRGGLLSKLQEELPTVIKESKTASEKGTVRKTRSFALEGGLIGKHDIQFVDLGEGEGVRAFIGSVAPRWIYLDSHEELQLQMSIANKTYSTKIQSYDGKVGDYRGGVCLELMWFSLPSDAISAISATTDPIHVKLAVNEFTLPLVARVALRALAADIETRESTPLRIERPR